MMSRAILFTFHPMKTDKKRKPKYDNLQYYLGQIQCLRELVLSLEKTNIEKLNLWLWSSNSCKQVNLQSFQHYHYNEMYNF